MRKIVIDTNILIDYVNGYASWLDNILQFSNDFILILPTIAIAEYFTSTTLEEPKQAKIADETFALFEKQDLTEEIAKVLGTILRRKTFVAGAGLADLIVAATALHLDAELATRNKAHFGKIPDLRFFKPAKTSS